MSTNLIDQLKKDHYSIRLISDNSEEMLSHGNMNKLAILLDDASDVGFSKLNKKDLEKYKEIRIIKIEKENM